MQSKKYYSIEPASFKLDGGAMFGIIPKPLWNKVHPADDLNRIELSLRLILLKKEEKIILIDTGIGDYYDAKFIERFGISGNPSPLEDALKSIGISPDDVTDLVISHLHFDHVGGIGKKENQMMIPVLKNAILHLHQKHFDYSLNPTERDTGSFHKENFLPVIEWYKNKHQIHFLTDLEGEILPGLKYVCSMGHTPYLMHAYDDKMIYMADLIPTSNHVHIPWVMGYDISPGITTEDKKRILSMIFEKNLTLIFEHDPLFFGSTIKKDPHGNFVCDKKFEKEQKLGYQIF